MKTSQAGSYKRKREPVDPNGYCVYILTDPRTTDYESGYKYGDYESIEKPFYVGQGFPMRPWAHKDEALKSPRKDYKLNKIRRILQEYECYNVEYAAVGRTRKEALALEIQLIATIGRSDLGTGPLTNLTDGGDGGSGMIVTAAMRKHKSAASKRMHAQRSEADKRQIYIKSGKSLRAFHASLSGAERKQQYAPTIKAKQKSITRIHTGYLHDLFGTLANVWQYLTRVEIAKLVPNIPPRTLENLLKEYSRQGMLKVIQHGANQPKRYLYVL